MKHGQTSTKELADFVRERCCRLRGGGHKSWAFSCQPPPPQTSLRAAIEESYAKAMVKLSKMATNGTQLG